MMSPMQRSMRLSMAAAGRLVILMLMLMAISGQTASAAGTGYTQYLPIVFAPQTFTGITRDNGTPVGNIALRLLYSQDGGSTYDVYATAVSRADGSFTFPFTPDVSGSANQFFVVEYDNDAHTPNPNYLGKYTCNYVDKFHPDYYCEINLHNVSLTAPADGAVLSAPPYQFSWTARVYFAANPDDYYFRMYDIASDSIVWQDELKTATTNTLYQMTGLYCDSPYLWRVDVIDRYGYGEGNQRRKVSFSSPCY